MLETARSMLELYERGVIEFKQRSISTVGKLRISLPAVFKRSIHPPSGEFYQRKPGYFLSISYSDLREDIIADSIDVALPWQRLPDSSLKQDTYLFYHDNWWRLRTCSCSTNPLSIPLSWDPCRGLG